MPYKKLWRNKEFKERRIKENLKNIFTRPTSYERKFILLCEKYNLPFIYTGDGKIIIENKNPDFIQSNGKKLIVETYSNYWHLLRDKNYEQNRRNIFAKYGYKTLFLNDDDIKNRNWEKICLNKVNKFMEGNN